MPPKRSMRWSRKLTSRLAERSTAGADAFDQVPGVERGAAPRLAELSRGLDRALDLAGAETIAHRQQVELGAAVQGVAEVQLPELALDRGARQRPGDAHRRAAAADLEPGHRRGERDQARGLVDEAAEGPRHRGLVALGPEQLVDLADQRHRAGEDAVAAQPAQGLGERAGVARQALQVERDHSAAETGIAARLPACARNFRGSRREPEREPGRAGPRRRRRDRHSPRSPSGMGGAAGAGGIRG